MAKKKYYKIETKEAKEAKQAISALLNKHIRTRLESQAMDKRELIGYIIGMKEAYCALTNGAEMEFDKGLNDLLVDLIDHVILFQGESMFQILFRERRHKGTNDLLGFLFAENAKKGGCYLGEPEMKKYCGNKKNN